MFCILLVFGAFLVTSGTLYVFPYFRELTVSEMRFGC